MTESVTVRPKTCSYLMDDCNTTIKKNCVIKRIIKVYKSYKSCFLKKEFILES